MSPKKDQQTPAALYIFYSYVGFLSTYYTSALKTLHHAKYNFNKKTNYMLNLTP